MIGSRISVGAGIKLTDTDLSRKATEGSPFIPEELLAFGVEAFDVVNRTDTESLGVEGTVGIFARLGAQWTFGAQVGLGWTRSHTTGRSELPPEFEMAPVRVDFTENTRSVNIRAGLGWRPSESFAVYADSAEVGRVFMGAEYMPLGQLLALRAGGSVDTDRQASVSTGIGFYPSRYFQGELAYVYNAFPEVRKEFGRAHLISLSIGMAF